MVRWFGSWMDDYDGGRPLEEPSKPPKNCIELPCINCLKKVRFYDVDEVPPIQQFCNKLCEWDFGGRTQRLRRGVWMS